MFVGGVIEVRIARSIGDDGGTARATMQRSTVSIAPAQCLLGKWIATVTSIRLNGLGTRFGRSVRRPRKHLTHIVRPRCVRLVTWRMLFTASSSSRYPAELVVGEFFRAADALRNLVLVCGADYVLGMPKFPSLETDASIVALAVCGTADRD